MKQLLFILLFLPGVLWAQLEIIPAKETPLVFGGKTQAIEVVFKNPTDKSITTDIRAQLFQASSATLLPIGEIKPWKKLQVLPGQTVIENIAVEFPSVRVITGFRVRFSDGDKQLADLKIRAAPEDLLKQLSVLTEKTPVGILDPDNQLKPLLKKCKVEFFDLEESNLENFSGKLVIAGPFISKSQMRDGLREQIKKLNGRSIAVVWMPPPPPASVNLLPSFYVVVENERGMVVVQPVLVADLSRTPQSQLNMIYFCKLALHPEPVRWPE